MMREIDVKELQKNPFSMIGVKNTEKPCPIWEADQEEMRIKLLQQGCIRFRWRVRLLLRRRNWYLSAENVTMTVFARRICWTLRMMRDGIRRRTIMRFILERS